VAEVIPGFGRPAEVRDLTEALRQHRHRLGVQTATGYARDDDEYRPTGTHVRPGQRPTACQSVGGLENRCGGNLTVGSNPTLSALDTTLSALPA
jgi:hypothetical protein